jgi:hypothetical protein
VQLISTADGEADFLLGAEQTGAEQRMLVDTVRNGSMWVRHNM